MKKRALFAAMGTTLALATAAWAQPAIIDLDLGTLTNPGTFGGTSSEFVAGEVKWVKFTIPAGNMTRAAGQFLDINTNGGTLTGNDSHIGLYNAAGVFIASNDDTGPGAYSQLSFGDTGPVRTAQAGTGNATTAGGTFAGINGADLPAGDYYLAITGFGGNVYGANFAATSTHARTGNMTVRVQLGTDTTPSNPSGVGSYTPVAAVVSGNSVHFKMVVTNGTFPTSTYANVGSGVTVDGTLIGAGTITLFDDGLHNDGAAGDREWGADVTVTAAAGNYTLPYSIQDDTRPAVTGNMPALGVFGPAPSCPPGSGAVSFTGVNSASATGGANNTTITAAQLGWTSADPLLGIHVSGRIQEVNLGTFSGEANFLVTFSDLTTVTLDPFGTGGGYTGFADVTNYFLAIPAGHNVNDIVSIEAVESFDDGADTLVDSTWTNLCFTYDSQTSPTGVAAATPNSGIVGSNTLLTCTVTPGQGPVSTGITVNANLANIGGGVVAMSDDGLTNGDVTAGDNVFSYNAVIGAVGGGAQSITFAIADAQARTGSASTNFNVVAAPSVFTDLGSVNCTGINQSFSIAAGEVKWFKMTIPAINDAPNYFADFWTNSTGTLADTEIGLYDNNGAIIDFDDDSGNGAKSMLTFGDTVNIRPDADGFDFDLDGFNGTLAGGTYWLAVGAFNTTYLTGWQATSTSAATGTVDLRANIADPSCITAPTNPTGVGSGGVVSGCGGNTLATVTVTGGLNPASTGITVSLDTTALGGGSVAMLDNGTGGDVTAGDNIFSATVAVGGGADAVIALPFTVSDAEARSSGGSLNVTRSGTEIGDLPATAQKYYGVSGSTIAGAMTTGDADMYAICVNDTAAFDATTIGGGPAFDSQLFLFNADGTGALMSDDDLAVAGFSRINAAAAAEPDYDLVSGGLYYIAVSAYNKDPITSGVATDTIWANQNNLASFLGTYGANGVTPTAPIAGWTTGGTANVAYTITMIGATTICPADLSGGTAGVPDCAVDINDLLYFLSAFEAGNADVDNGSGTGALDCATDINDLLFFLTRFEAGC